MTRLLLVEDDSSLGQTLSERLTEEGYTVVWAHSCEGAIQKFLENSIDLVLLDIGLPDGSGFSVARAVREKNSTPLIFLTAMNSAEFRLEGFEIGADDYIPKPFHLRELLLRVSRVLEAKGIRKTIEAGKISIDPDSFSIILPNGELSQPAVRDFELLKLLIMSAPRVLSREELHQKLWPEDSESSTFRSIDNAVLRLRTIFRKISDEEYIRSVRGVGYQWVGEKT
ncbi:MAG: response regulator transcription factor [SAR324 cluster bacterium]|uniref:Response regulator transcription factor n=1 Tax=SAR324 cluster bacterium TaxID=2024889 RepID=A0A7X9ILC8_9DELT|nr:response regulator transcription factor [SAR324 cluster bacterium]